MKQYNLDEMEINLKDLFCAVCMKWKSIIVMMLLFSVLAGGYSYMKSQNVQIEVENEPIEISDDMVRLQHYYEIQNGQQQYMQESPLMQMDESKVNYMTMVYDIALPDGIEEEQAFEKQKVLVEAYKNELKSDELYTQISRKTNGKVLPEYMKELISAVDMEYHSALSLENTNIIDSSSVFIITIMGYDEVFCKKVAECIQSKIADTEKQLSESLGVHTIQLISSSNQQIYDGGILSSRTNFLNQVQTVANNIVATEKLLTEDEIEYVEKLVAGELNAEGEVVPEQETAESEPVSQPSVSVKYVVIGLLLGAFLAAGFWGCIYIMNGKLHVADELDSMWGIKTYSRKDTGKKAIGINKLIYGIKTSSMHLFEEEELLEVLKAEVSILADKQNAKKIFMTGTGLTDSDKELIEKLQNTLVGTDISISVGSSVLYNPVSMALLADADAVILFEQVEKSSLAEIGKELQECADKGVSVIGCVVSGM